MSYFGSSRRQFIKTSAGVMAAGAIVPAWLAELAYGYQGDAAAKSERPRLGAIGVGGQGTGIMQGARQFADLLAVCDVDRNHAERAQDLTKSDAGKAEIYEDYRKLLDRKDIDVVTIGTPDHWHTAVCVAALKAGKDVYCEKPLTLTIDEGKLLVKTVEETGRVLQVGTQQRSDVNTFIRAVATVHSGQIGKLKHVTVSLPLSTAEGGPFDPQPVPQNLNWDFWLGQAPHVEYVPQRCHFNFRWWYEYSGGIITDWGAHHMDIAQWGMDVQNSGPLTIDGSQTKLPTIENGYNTPKTPVVDYTYAGDIHLQLTTGDEFVVFEGENGRIKVNRGRVTGKAIEDQDADKSLQDKTSEWMTKVYKGRPFHGHMGDFFAAVKSREQPISDVVSQHRSVSACHLGNISCRLGRKLTWNPEQEMFVDDEAANAMLSRKQRSPYEINA